jgi:hypothetical protein
MTTVDFGSRTIFSSRFRSLFPPNTPKSDHEFTFQLGCDNHGNVAAPFATSGENVAEIYGELRLWRGYNQKYRTKVKKVSCE